MPPAQYAEPYSQHQQAPYGSQPTPAMPPTHASTSEGASAADPFAAYGGYQNYMAMWYAAVANQPGQGPPPPA